MVWAVLFMCGHAYLHIFHGNLWLVWDIKTRITINMLNHMPLLLEMISFWGMTIWDLKLCLLSIIFRVRIFRVNEIACSISRPESKRTDLGLFWKTRCCFKTSTVILTWVGTKFASGLFITSHPDVRQLNCQHKTSVPRIHCSNGYISY